MPLSIFQEREKLSQRNRKPPPETNARATTNHRNRRTWGRNSCHEDVKNSVPPPTVPMVMPRPAGRRSTRPACLFINFKITSDHISPAARVSKSAGSTPQTQTERTGEMGVQWCCFRGQIGQFPLMEIKLRAEEHATLENGASAVRAFDNIDRGVSCSGQ